MVDVARKAVILLVDRLRRVLPGQPARGQPPTPSRARSRRSVDAFDAIIRFFNALCRLTAGRRARRAVLAAPARSRTRTSSRHIGLDRGRRGGSDLRRGPPLGGLPASPLGADVLARAIVLVRDLPVQRGAGRLALAARSGRHCCADRLGASAGAGAPGPVRADHQAGAAACAVCSDKQRATHAAQPHPRHHRGQARCWASCCGYGHLIFESAAQVQGLREIRYIARPRPGRPRHPGRAGAGPPRRASPPPGSASRPLRAGVDPVVRARCRPAGRALGLSPPRRPRMWRRTGAAAAVRPDRGGAGTGRRRWDGVLAMRRGHLADAARSSW